MRKILVLVLVFVSSAAYCQGKIEVVVTNIKVRKGDIRIGLFNNAKDFLEKPIDGKVVRVEGDKVIVQFEGLINGEYAISVFHDENSNQELDTNFFGIPREGFAFGNNAMGTFGPPSFEKAKVMISNNFVQQKIVLKYF